MSGKLESIEWGRTEKRRRLWWAYKLVKDVNGVRKGIGEVGIRLHPVYLTSEEVFNENISSRAWYGERDDDDLDDFVQISVNAHKHESIKPGSVVHVYLTVKSGWDYELLSTCCVWLGDDEHDPILLDVDGRQAWKGKR